MERSRSRNASRSSISGSKDLLQQQQHGVAGPAKFRDVSPPREDAHPLPAAASASAAAAAAAAAWHYYRPATGSAAAAAAALQHLVMDQRGAGSGRKKSSSGGSGGAAGTGAAAARDAVRDLSGIRREDVERKREEIGKERPSWQPPPRVRDENERRKEALALLRMKLEAHVRRTTDKGLREWSRDQVAGGGGGGGGGGGVVNSSKPAAAAAGVKNSGGLNDDDWGARVLRKLADDDFSNRKSAGAGRGRAAAAAAAAQAAADEEAEEAIVVVSGTPPALDADAADVRLSVDADGATAAASAAGAAEEGNVTVKDIYFVESVKQRAPPPGGDDGHEEAECETAEEESEKKSYAAAAPAAVVEEARVPVSSNHLKLAEKVAKLMEDLDSPADDDADQQHQHQQQPHQAMGTTPGGLASARLKLRVIDDGDAGPIVLMKCSSRDHARVVCETLSAQLGPAQETIVTSTAQGGGSKRQQQHHFQFQGTNRLASFLRKAFSSSTAPSSAAPSRSSTARFRHPPPPVDINVNGGGSSAASTDDVSGATATTFDSSTGSFFSREAKDAVNWSGTPPDRESVAAAGGRRRVRSANASPVPSLVHGGKATTGGGGYLARFLATPARKPFNLDRTRSVGRSNDDDATTASRAISKFKASRLFSFPSPNRGSKQQKQQHHRFEDRLGPNGNGDGPSAAAAGKHNFRDRLLSFTSPARRRNKKSDHSGGGTGAGSTADGHSHADNRDRWSGLLGSPTGAGGVGTFSGPPASSDQSWGFLGGLGSPVRDAAGTRKSGGTGWGPVYSLTDVDVPVGGAGAGDGNGGDGAGAGGPGQELEEEPTSPQVTCIGRVKAKAPRCNGAATGTQQHHRQQHVHSFSGLDASVPAPGAHSWTDSSAGPNNVNTKPPTVPHHHQHHHHSGPVFGTAPLSHHHHQPKTSRWRSLLGLYRSHGPSTRRAGPPPAPAPAALAEAETAAEAVDAAAVDPHDVCLSRCRKTSFQRFAASDSGIEGPDNPTAAAAAAAAPGPPQFLLGHKAESTASSRARDSVQAWLEEAADPEDLENAQLEEEWRAGTGTGTGGGGGSEAEHVYGQQQGGTGVVVSGGDRDGKEQQQQQSLLWQRRQFTRPKTLDIEPAGTTGTGPLPRPISE